MPMIHCPHCNAANPDYAQLCTSCRKSLRIGESAQPVPTAQTGASARPQPSPANDGPLCIATGHTGILEVYKTRVVIRRHTGIGNLLLFGAKGNKEIQIRKISSIQYKLPGIMFAGYIQFTFDGGAETKKALTDAVSDENTVMFRPQAQHEFDRAKKLIEELMEEAHRPAMQQVVQHRSPLDEIEHLARLRDAGIVTEQEFLLKKKELLGL